MTRDALNPLRDADPVPHPVAYPADEAARRVADILAADGRRDTLVMEPVPAKTGRWMVPVSAAAAVLMLAVGSALLIGHDSSGPDHDAAGATRPVSCTVSDAGTPAARQARQRLATQVVRTRVSEAGGTVRKFTGAASGGQLRFTPLGLDPVEAQQACAVTTTAIRSLVTSPVAVDRSAPRSSDPLAALPFPAPADEHAYARLSPAQRSQLRAAMSHYDCAGTTTAGSAALLCSAQDGATKVYLLTPQLVAGTDIASATAVRPQASAGAGWTVRLRPDAAAAARLAAYTSRHHSSGGGEGLQRCGRSGGTPCADFLALTVDGRVVSAPQTGSTLSTAVQLSGQFTERTASDLAIDYTAASIQLRPS